MFKFIVLGLVALLVVAFLMPVLVQSGRAVSEQVKALMKKRRK